MNHVNVRLVLAKVPYTTGWPRQLVDSLLYNGGFGVSIFFVVSGFLITSTTIRRWGRLDRVKIRDFYALRFARIAPLLLLLLAVLSALHLAHVKDFVIPTARGGLGRALLAALTLHVNVLEARRGYLPGNWDILWSLSVEEMFYLFFPLVCRVFGRGKLLIAVLLSLIVLGPLGRTVFAHGLWREYSYLGGIDGIALGCLTAIVLSRREYSRPLIRAIGSAGIILLFGSIAFTLPIYASALGPKGLATTLLDTATCLVIAGAAQTRWRCPHLFQPVLTLGRRSYEVYLTHMFVVFACLHVFLFTGKRTGAVPIYFVAVIVFGGVLGELVGQFYSELMNRWLRKCWGDGPETLGSVVDFPEDAAQSQILAGAAPPVSPE